MVQLHNLARDERFERAVAVRQVWRCVGFFNCGLGGNIRCVMLAICDQP